MAVESDGAIDVTLEDDTQAALMELTTAKMSHQKSLEKHMALKADIGVMILFTALRHFAEDSDDEEDQLVVDNSLEFWDDFGNASPNFLYQPAVLLSQVSSTLDLRCYVRPGDIITICRTGTWGHSALVLARPEAVKVSSLFGGNHVLLTENVTVFYIKLLLSDSPNTCALKVAHSLFVVHPTSQQIVVVQEVPGGVRIVESGEGPLQADILLSPLSATSTDMLLFQQSVKQVLHTAQAVFVSGHQQQRTYMPIDLVELRFADYPTPDVKQQLARLILHKHSVCPDCSTVPPRVWQTYLMLRAQKQCAPTGGQDADIIFAEDVLKVMPVKEDRVSPHGLMKILQARGLWQSIDFQLGPPPHRASDVSTPRKIQQAIMPALADTSPPREMQQAVMLPLAESIKLASPSLIETTR